VLGHGGNERRERRKRYQAREKGCDKDSNQMAHNTTEDSRQLKSDVKPRVAVEDAHFQLSIAKRAGKSF
jgi:hypothetical protein